MTFLPKLSEEVVLVEDGDEVEDVGEREARLRLNPENGELKHRKRNRNLLTTPSRKKKFSLVPPRHDRQEDPRGTPNVSITRL